MRCPVCDHLTAEQRFCGQCGTRLTEIAPGYDAMDRVNEVLNGRYHLRSLLGIGGNGAVYRAEVIGVGHTVAVKVLHPTSDSVARVRLENEARLASGIDHPNIVAILDFHTSPQLTYLVMEHLSGLSLADVLMEIGRLGVRRTIHIARQVLAALDASHKMSVLHRDLKPENIYLTAQQDDLDFVKVLDFGMAQGAHQHEDARITADGHVCGTPAYMAPEQVRNKVLSHQTDLYAVGVLIYECLTGVNPFLADSAAETLVKHLTLTAEIPSKVCKAANIPPYLDALVMRALRKEPTDRFRSAEEFRWVLEGLVIAQRRKVPTEEKGVRTCSECGKLCSTSSDFCDACGTALTTRPALERDAISQALSPEEITALDASNVSNEFDISPTTVTAFRSVGWDPDLVGRHRELDVIQDIFDVPLDASQPRRFLRIVGNAGAGKSRLAREAARLADGWRVVWVEAELEPALAALYPIQRAAARLLRALEPVDREKALLASALEAGFDIQHRVGLLELYGIAEASVDTAPVKRARRAKAWREAVRCAAEKDPLLIVFQDMHLFDAPSQELIATLVADEPTAHPVVVIATHDPQLLLLWAETETMTLPLLSAKEAKELANTLFDHVGLRGEIDEIVFASGGNPLLLIELVWLKALDPSLSPPNSLAETINQRISRLPPRTRMLLHTMAVLGRPATSDTLVTFLDADAEAEERALKFLANQGLLVGGSSGWRHAHRLHRQVAYASTPATVRKKLHAKAAVRAIGEGTPAAVVAHHLCEAGEPEQAVPYLLRAGRNALDSLDDRLASELFGKVRQLIPAPPEEFRGERGPWLAATLGLSEALRDGGDTTAAVHLLQRAAEDASRASWEEERGCCEEESRKLKTPTPSSDPKEALKSPSITTEVVTPESAD